MKAIRFRVENFRNIDDSGWIKLDRVTAFVGRNESGKTSLLKALHKFNPATPEPYDPQRDFPRTRYTSEYIRMSNTKWPVCSVEFELSEELRATIAGVLGGTSCPTSVIATRYYDDDSVNYEFKPPIIQQPLVPTPIISALSEFASSSRRLELPNLDAESAKGHRAALSRWASGWSDNLKDINDLRSEQSLERLIELRQEAEGKSDPQTAASVELLLEIVDKNIDTGRKDPVKELISTMDNNLPVMIYFENYGILDSSIWLSRYIEDLERDPTNPRIRTIHAMFKHVGLSPQDITDLGEEQARLVQAQGNTPTAEQIREDQRRKEERAIKLSSASLDISERFASWWSQRRHKIRYHADGNYFRIWIADNLRPDVEIELESRSKGFQWFFSFYLVFLMESEEGHKDAILLLDEPGLHLHPTAQQELIVFFEELSESNQLVYTTHSPFLIDGEHLHRVRPVTEDESGRSRISAESWPEDRETIFPLQAAAGYALMRGLFRHHKNVLVEGMSDYYYLHALSLQCARSSRTALPDDIHLVPCGGTKNVGTLASLFLGEQVRPVILLDGDEAGRARQNALMRRLYTNEESDILMLDSVLNRVGQEVEIEDLIGEDLVSGGLNKILGCSLSLDGTDLTRSLPNRIKDAARREGIDLPVGWKATVALDLVSALAEKNLELKDEVLDRASTLFAALQARFGAGT